MSQQQPVDRRRFLQGSLTAAGTVGMVAAAAPAAEPAAPATAKPAEKPADKPAGAPASEPAAKVLPYGMIGKVKISRMLLGGNLVSGFMHARDLKYVNRLFRAYATEEKIIETLRVAEQHGINTVFETGANFVKRYNNECNGHMQFIPHIRVDQGQSEVSLKDHIKRQVDSGAVALYVWGVSSDQLVQAGQIPLLAKAVELGKAHGLPVGVGGHSLLVPMECEKHQVPCDFYVKTLHNDDYPSATPKELRKEFIWISGGKGWYDNMWCINPQETVAFMSTVKKPWLAFKVLAAGAYFPRDGFKFAFESGADFIAVGMFDFQISENADTLKKVLSRMQKRQRAWFA